MSLPVAQALPVVMSLPVAQALPVTRSLPGVWGLVKECCTLIGYYLTVRKVTWPCDVKNMQIRSRDPYSQYTFRSLPGTFRDGFTCSTNCHEILHADWSIQVTWPKYSILIGRAAHSRLLLLFSITKYRCCQGSELSCIADLAPICNALLYLFLLPRRLPRITLVAFPAKHVITQS